MSQPRRRTDPSNKMRKQPQSPSDLPVLHGVIETEDTGGDEGISPRQRSVQGLNSVFQGSEAPVRLARLRRSLAVALEAWWRAGKMPSLGLLRDGLLALEAGQELDEPERTLLLRTSLYYGKGMLTALAHQSDPERIAHVIADMLLNPQRPLSPLQVRQLLAKDPNSQSWRHPLILALQTEAAQPLEPRRTLAQAAILCLQGGIEPGTSRWEPLSRADRAPDGGIESTSLADRAAAHRWARFLRWLAAMLLVAALAAFWWDIQLTRAKSREMVVVPAGVYLISDVVSPEMDRLVRLESFALDRTEVTNRQYRRCYEERGCPWPSQTASRTHPNYLLDPAFNDYPVVNVDWSAANAFCAWAGKRLPLAEEWEVAAASAQTMQRRYRYPWGDSYDMTLANGSGLGIGDTEPVGVHSPAGDSPFGAADMAGNVAEWTASPGRVSNTYVVKGGSFLDGPQDLRASARQELPAEESQPWLGFRCAATVASQ